MYRIVDLVRRLVLPDTQKTLITQQRDTRFPFPIFRSLSAPTRAMYLRSQNRIER